MTGKVKYTIPSDAFAYTILANFRDVIVQDADLGVDGRVSSFDLVLRDGLNAWTDTANDYLAAQYQFSVQLGRAHCLSPKDETDGSVLLYIAAKSVQLVKMNKLLGNMADFTAPDMQYQPYVPVAYINPDAASLYENMSLGGFINHLITSFDIVLADDSFTTVDLLTL